MEVFCCCYVYADDDTIVYMESDDGDDLYHHVDYVVDESCIVHSDRYDIDNGDKYGECGAYYFEKDHHKPHRITYSPSPRIKNNLSSLLYHYHDYYGYYYHPLVDIVTLFLILLIWSLLLSICRHRHIIPHN